MKFRMSAARYPLLAMALILSAPSLQAAEKKELTYVKTEARTLSKSTMAISAAPNHEVVQEIQLHNARFSDPEFQPIEEVIYIHTDQTDGNGSHKGYYIMRHKSGEQTYGAFEGAHKTVVKDDGSWASSWQGTYRYLGGSGRYKNIKGQGTYKGRASPNEPFYEEGRETIEY